MFVLRRAYFEPMDADEGAFVGRICLIASVSVVVRRFIVKGGGSETVEAAQVYQLAPSSEVT